MLLEALSIGVAAFIIGFLLGWGSNRRLMIELNKTALAVLSLVTETLDRLTDILDKLVSDLDVENLSISEEDKRKILEVLNSIETSNGEKVENNTSKEGK